LAARSASRTASSTESRSTPGIDGNRRARLRSVDQEQRPDQIVDGEHIFGHQPARPVGLAIAPRSDGEVKLGGLRLHRGEPGLQSAGVHT